MHQHESVAQDGVGWPNRLRTVVAAQVRRYRKARGMSAQQLADRCAELGLPISRSAIANLENGRPLDKRRQQHTDGEVRRPAVTVEELLVLARALHVPVPLLIAPLGSAPEAEILPGVTVPASVAARWVSGTYPDLRDGNIGIRDPLVQLVHLSVSHEVAITDLRVARRRIDEGSADPSHYLAAGRAWARLRAVRDDIVKLAGNGTAPALPSDLAWVDLHCPPEVRPAPWQQEEDELPQGFRPGEPLAWESPWTADEPEVSRGE